VRLAQLLIDKPNVLVLDEPTNHLDIPSREALERTLGDFPGTILCVSHDRYFLDRVIQRLLVLRPPEVEEFGDTYSAWNRARAEAAAEQRAAASARSAPAKAKQKPAPAPAKKNNPYARPFGRLTMAELERQITDTEVALAECQASFGEFKEPARAQQLRGEYEALSAKLKALEAEYFAREQ
jgi:ATP-binding cassette subfamily F protein 3